MNTNNMLNKAQTIKNVLFSYYTFYLDISSILSKEQIYVHAYAYKNDLNKKCN